MRPFFFFLGLWGFRRANRRAIAGVGGSLILGGNAKERERDADSLIFELTAARKAKCGLFEAGSILSRSGRAPRFADSDLRDIVHGLKRGPQLAIPQGISSS